MLEVDFSALLAAIEEKLALHQPFTLAIEGGSASGKTTLAAALQKQFGCPVFHADDFFLQPHQRTPERLSQPGGNMDRERLLQEVLLPLSRGEAVLYRRFDCGNMVLLPPVQIPYAPFRIVEGAYSMHPDLAEQYGLSVFVRVSPQEQHRRILQRNTPEQAQRFFDRWIPMETAYFQALSPADRCDLLLRSYP